MSQVYATEPSTTGKVTFQTSYGPLEILLWCKECPSTCKYFLQLCHDGYFNSLKFHRIVPGFLIQTGLRENNNTENNDDNNKRMKQYRSDIQADQVIERQSLELHSRLKFNHRGQIAMAFNLNHQKDEYYTQGDIEMIQPQFFITLDEAPYLNAKHVLFGTIRGPTVFNALRIGNVEINADTNAPLDMENAPYIQSIQIHSDSFPDTEPLLFQATRGIPWKQQQQSTQENESKKTGITKAKKKKKRKGKRDANVLSFGDEFMGDDPQDGLGGIQSSHDVIAKDTTNTATGKTSSLILSNKVDEKVKQALEGDETVPLSSNNKDKEGKDHVDNPQSSTESPPTKRSKKVEKEELTIETTSSKIETNNEQQQKQVTTTSTLAPACVQDDIKEKTVASRVVDEEPSNTSNRATKQDKKKKKMSAVEAMRAKYKSKTSSSKHTKRTREEETMAKLMNFQSKVQSQVAQTKKLQRNGGGGDHHDEVDNEKSSQPDNSLASRMARRIETEESFTSKRRTDGRDDVEPSYHGQILENDDDDDDLEKNSWLGTKFSCRRHIDHVSRGAGGRLEEMNKKNTGGADGRNADDDYVVIDEKSRKNVQQPQNGGGGYGNNYNKQRDGRQQQQQQQQQRKNQDYQHRGYRSNDRSNGGGGENRHRRSNHHDHRPNHDTRPSHKHPSSSYRR